MSKEFAQSFFPSFTSFASSPNLAPYFLVNAWNSLFPHDVVTLCGLHPQKPYIPQRPCLAIAAIIGIFIGMGSGAERPISHKNNGSGSTLAFAIQDSWSKSSVAFGFMNIAGLLHHCIIPPRAPYQDAGSPWSYSDNFLWGADCIFTGLSSMHLNVIAWLLYCSYAGLKCSVKKIRMAVVISFSATAAILSILWEKNHNGYIGLWAATMTSIELIYLVPLKSAALALFPLAAASAFNVAGMRDKNSTAGARVAVLGGTLVVASIIFDASLCYFVSEHAPSIKASPVVYDLYHVGTLVFLGCDIAFWGMGLWIKALTRLILANEKEK